MPFNSQGPNPWSLCPDCSSAVLVGQNIKEGRIKITSHKCSKCPKQWTSVSFLLEAQVSMVNLLRSVQSQEVKLLGPEGFPYSGPAAPEPGSFQREY